MDRVTISATAAEIIRTASAMGSTTMCMLDETRSLAHRARWYPLAASFALLAGVLAGASLL